MKGMVGIYLAPDSALFETRMRVYNRTDTRRSFLWWENAAVPVNENYRIFFPHDVSYVQFHYRKDVTTYPLASGLYNGIDMQENNVDIRFHSATRQPTSYFCGETNEDFFGGFDEKKKCGVVHVADRFTSIGKKMFTWAYNQLSKSWENALTDNDGEYAELMAGSYSSNQPDFAWLEPYESKTFTQVWYPIGSIGVPDCATYHAAIHCCESGINLQTTAIQEKAVLLVDGHRYEIDTLPCQPVFVSCTVKNEVTLTDREGRILLNYALKPANPLSLPDRLPSMLTLDTLHTAQDCYLCGIHVDQYRDPVIRPDAYFEKALRIDEDHVPSLTALATYRYQMGEIHEALSLAKRAYEIATRWNFHMSTGDVEYIIGLCYEALSEYCNAYKHFQQSFWNADSRAKSMTHISRIDGIWKQYSSMLNHAKEALIHNADNNIAYSLRAVAEYRLGDIDKAIETLGHCLQIDPLDYLANILKVLIKKKSLEQYINSIRCDQAQVALDIAYDLKEMGESGWAIQVLSAVKNKTAMTAYAYADLTGFYGERICTLDYGIAYPFRQSEENSLKKAVRNNAKDANAYFGLGCLLYSKRRYAEATDSFNRAEKLNSDDPVILRCLAVCYFSHQNRKEEALVLLQKALQLSPLNQQLLFETSYVMTRLEHPAQSKISLILQHMSTKRRDDILIELAQAYNLSEQYDKVLELMSNHTFIPCEGGEHALADQYMFAQFGLGIKAMQSKHYEEALMRFRLAQTIPQNLGAGLWNVVKLVPHKFYEALCLKQIGDASEALSIFNYICSVKKDYFSDMHLPELALS